MVETRAANACYGEKIIVLKIIIAVSNDRTNKNLQNSTIWGNGRDWRDAPAKDGDWVRVFPVGFSSNVKKK